MRLPIPFVIIFGFAGLVFSCRTQPRVIEHPEFGAVFDSLQVKGSFLLYDSSAGEYHTFDSARCRQGFLPASTFKIPNSLISLETGALRDTSEVLRWDSLPRAIEAWNRDHTLRTAFQTSCVPCFQQLAHRVGVERMRYYTQLTGYGNMVIDTNSIADFWLEGPSAISQYQQIDFLRRLQAGTLPFRAENQAIVRDIMLVEETPQYRIRAKTGWAVVGRQNIGWWVGWLERNDHVYFFATNIEAPDTAPDFGEKRQAVTRELLRRLQLL